RDCVRNTVAIEIAKGHAMQLGKGHISGIFRRKIAHNGMLYEGNGAVLVALLLEPCESPSVSVKSRDDVVQTVAVHVINTHLGASGAEGCGMIGPRLLRGALRRMFPPSTGRYDVHAAVTVDISHTHAVPTHEAPFRDFVHDPGGGGVFRIGL